MKIHNSPEVISDLHNEILTAPALVEGLKRIVKATTEDEKYQGSRDVLEFIAAVVDYCYAMGADSQRWDMN